MRDDFCVFILTHGRPDRVDTVASLQKAGYRGKVYIVIDDEDETRAEYERRYGSQVIVFDKRKYEDRFDIGDNFGHRRGVIYARNACWDLAAEVGCKYFMQLDDDYNYWHYRHDRDGYMCINITCTFHEMLDALIEFFEVSGALTVAMSQGGDHIGGANASGNKNLKVKRKAMNSFICSVDRPFTFFGRINEDTNTYTEMARRGGLFLTMMPTMLVQRNTQTNSGGMTGLYLEFGTYLKSFYSVMYAPSAVKISTLGRGSFTRIHHEVATNNACPKIMHERHRRL